jgi:hypothetical protein
MILSEGWLENASIAQKAGLLRTRTRKFNES